MRRLSFFLLLLPVGVSAEAVIRDVAVVDVPAGVIHPHRRVAIEGNRNVDGRGKFLIPGLWDMRGSPQSARQLRSHGIVGARVIGPTKRPAVESLVLVSGSPVEESEPRQARDAFDRLWDAGVDFVAVGPGISREAYIAFTEQARHWRLPIVGPVPRSMNPWETVEARQNTIEGLDALLAMNDRDLAAFLARCAMMGTRIAPLLRERILDARVKQLLRQAKGAGVVLIAASGGGPTEFFEELKSLARAGLTPREVLEAATAAPRNTRMDLVLLGANPLVDIQNLSRVEMVMRGVEK